IVPGYPKLKNAYTLLWDMENNDGYINIVAVMQKYFDQAISGNWSYNPLHYDNHEVPLSAMAKDMLNAYKFGWKTSYYQNTYDFKGEEEDVQPSGIDTSEIYDHLKTAPITGVNGEAGLNGEAKPQAEKILQSETNSEEDCDACTI
ncbi:uncharacterized protein METZ01_LOCUS142204, partial [marine metagenome]